MRCVHVVFCKNCSIFYLYYLYYQYCKSNLLANIVDIENLKIITKTKKKTQWELFANTAQWNAIRNDNTSSQKVLFFFYFFYRYHFTVKNKKFWENSKFIELTSLVKWPTWLFNGKVTNILLSVLTLFLSSFHALFNFSTVSRLLHLLFFLL